MFEWITIVKCLLLPAFALKRISELLPFPDSFLEFVDERGYNPIMYGDFNNYFLVDSRIKTEFETLPNSHSCHNSI